MKWIARPSARYSGQQWLVDADERLWGMCDFVKAKFHRPCQMYGMTDRQLRAAERLIDAGWLAETYNWMGDQWTHAWHPDDPEDLYELGELDKVLAKLPPAPARCPKTKDLFDAAHT